MLESSLMLKLVPVKIIVPMNIEVPIDSTISILFSHITRLVNCAYEYSSFFIFFFNL